MKGSTRVVSAGVCFRGISESVVSIDNLSKTGWVGGGGVVLKKTTETESEWRDRPL